MKGAITMIRTQSYLKTYEICEVKPHHSYYFGELSDGSYMAYQAYEDIEDGSGAITMWDEDDNELLVTFEVIEPDNTDYLDTVVRIKAIIWL